MPEEGAEHCASVAPPYFARGSFTLTEHAHGRKHTKMSIKLIESGLAWHRERRIGNKIKVLINCGFRPLSSGKRDMKELQGGGCGSHSLKRALQAWLDVRIPEDSWAPSYSYNSQKKNEKIQQNMKTKFINSIYIHI